MAKFNIKTALYVAAAIAVGIQVVPVHRDNPPATTPITPPAPVAATLRRSCYDCHSNETKWPWYSYVAPVSWMVTHDVHEGRQHMDLSTWGDYPTAKKRKLLASISDMVQQREMPLWYYLPMHKGAQLTDDDVSELAMWADSSDQGED